MNLIPGSYVTHAKLPELGSGEIMSFQDDTMSIRFGSGNRVFRVELVMPHLARTNEAPPPAKAARRPRKPKAPKLVTKTKASARHAAGEPTVV